MLGLRKDPGKIRWDYIRDTNHKNHEVTDIQVPVQSMDVYYNLVFLYILFACNAEYGDDMQHAMICYVRISRQSDLSVGRRSKKTSKSVQLFLLHIHTVCVILLLFDII